MKSIVLFSSGLDSTVNLYEALRDGSVVEALTFDYGQRAAPRETEMAARHCQKLNVRHRTLALPWFREFTKTSLVDRSQSVPKGVRIESQQESEKSATLVWVPNRNGIFLNIAAAFAEGLGADCVIPGFNREEAATFPDNTAEYLEACTRSLSYSTSNQIQIKCYTTSMDKREIVARGRQLGVDFSLVWPCYEGGHEPCGQCESCLRFRRAFL